MSASAARHETRALLRAHLAAASAYRHLTRHCAVCHRLLRLAMEPGAAPGAGEAAEMTPDRSDAAQDAAGRPDGNEDERPPTTRPSAG
ncbi:MULTISPECIES: DUF6274 family protein [unclassified Streptomyces]|uniref:DUF6274 family protein n=1 Tax=Streptomyces TaxID=1883 RepID=UPI0010C195BB|nr:MULTISPECIES: DUF6274 family protein [unclassified Streptomyces]MBV7246045.1 hypothetical protein [Streptomyces sp. MW-W600-10]